MMMTRAMFVMLVLHGCGSSPPPATWRASIGSKPFVPRAALVTDVNTTRHTSGPCSPTELDEAKAESPWFASHPEAWSTCSSTKNGPVVVSSQIYIFEREVSCDELRVARRRVAQNEHAITIDLTGVWPPAPRTTLRSHDDHADPRAGHVDATFADYRASDGNSGYYAFGTVTVLAATPTDGQLALDLVDASGDSTARGMVDVTVCP